jgi:subtilisin family serine protease
MKKWLIVLIATISLTLTPTFAFAEYNTNQVEVKNETIIKTNDSNLVLNEQQDKYLKISTYESSGNERNTNQTIQVFLADKELEIPIKGHIASLNGQRIPIDSTALIMDGDRISPFQIVGKNADEVIQWHHDNHKISVFTKEYLEKTANAKLNHDQLTGKGVKMAVIDTGIAKHMEINVKEGVNFINPFASYEDDHGHGTAVAGVIASKQFGVSPGVELYSLKVLGANNRGEGPEMVKSIEWAIENDIDIINMSISMDAPYYPLDNAIKKAIEHDIIIVACSGNTGSYVTSPASLPGVISVGAFGTDSKTKASFSAYIGRIDYMAVGLNVYSTTLLNSYAIWSGTSFASPYVAGIFALYKEAFPELNANELKSLIDKQSEISHYDDGFVPDTGWKIPQKPKMEEQKVYVPIKDDHDLYIGVEMETSLVPSLQ